MVFCGLYLSWRLFSGLYYPRGYLVVATSLDGHLLNSASLEYDQYMVSSGFYCDIFVFMVFGDIKWLTLHSLWWFLLVSCGFYWDIFVFMVFGDIKWLTLQSLWWFLLVSSAFY